jgi:hypothetical protein
MNITWNEWAIGKEGDFPDIWLLNTDATLDEITSEGFSFPSALSAGAIVFATYISSGAVVSSVFSVQLDAGERVLIDLSAGTGSVTGATNLPNGLGIYNGLAGSNLTLKSFIGNNGVDIEASEDGNNLIFSAPASAGFEYENTFWVAQNGDDDYNGKSIGEPKLTLASVQAAMPAGVPVVINIEDAGTYVVDNFITTGPTIINAPGATFIAGSSSFMFQLGNTGSLLCIFNTINPGSGKTAFSSSYTGNALFCKGVLIGACNSVWLDSGRNSSSAVFNVDQITSGSFQFSSLSGINSVYSRHIGTCTFNSFCPDPININADYCNATSFTGTANYVLNCSKTGGSFVPPNSANYSGNLGNKLSNFVGRVVNNNSVFGEIFNITNTINDLTPYTVQISDTNGAIGIYNVSGTVDIYLPDVETLPGLYPGWRCYAWQGYSGGGARFRTLGNDSIQTNTGVFTRLGLVTIILTSNSQDPDVGRLWTLSGEVAGSASVLTSGFPVSVIDSPALTNLNLASAAHVTVLEAPTSTVQYKISNIILNGVGATSFATGDRDLQITDGTHVWTTIPAATLQALVNASLGSASVPFSTTIKASQLSTAGADIFAVYANGTSDYTSGSVTITLEYERVAL